MCTALKIEGAPLHEEGLAASLLKGTNECLLLPRKWKMKAELEGNEGRAREGDLDSVLLMVGKNVPFF